MYGIYVEAQNGFRRGRGTVDSAFVLYSIVNEYLEQGKKLYTFFIDYSKAFDYIVHDNLWYKFFYKFRRPRKNNWHHSFYV